MDRAVGAGVPAGEREPLARHLSSGCHYSCRSGLRGHVTASRRDSFRGLRKARRRFGVRCGACVHYPVRAAASRAEGFSAVPNGAARLAVRAGQLREPA